MKTMTTVRTEMRTGWWCGAVCAAGWAGMVVAWPVIGGEPPPAVRSGAAVVQQSGAAEGEPSGSGSAEARCNSEFRPSVHGFAFTNSFTGSPLPPALRDPGSPIGRALRGLADGGTEVPQSFGLCGGMSAAAADFFYARASVPAVSKPPVFGTRFYDYIQQRQFDSLGSMGFMALKFAEWMRLPDVGENSTTRRTAAEVPGIVERLRSGQLVPLGLVKTKVGAGVIWDNHQVLAYGVAAAGVDAVELRVYDPNYPGDDEHVIRIGGLSAAEVSRVRGEEGDGASRADGAEVGGAAGAGVVTIMQIPSRFPAGRLGVAGRRPKAFSLRGVFAMPYEVAKPPEAAALEVTEPVPVEARPERGK